MGKVGTDIQQGDIVLVNLDPIRGREQSGVRPAVVVSAEAFHVSMMTFVCPLTTKIKHFMGDPILNPSKSNGLAEVSEILVGQMRAISVDRISKKIGMITKRELHEIFLGFDLLCDRG